jgi:hypothetical protein
VDQHDRRPFAPLDDMQAHAVDLQQRRRAAGRARRGAAAFDPGGGQGCTEQRGGVHAAVREVGVVLRLDGFIARS